MSFFIVLVVLLLDQLSKFYVKNILLEPVQIFAGLFEIAFVKNTGIAFSLFSDSALVLTIINSIIVFSIMIWSFIKHKFSPGLAFIIAGGLGNLLDRYMHGYVVDFINPLFVNFAVFNIADIALNIGIVFLFMEMAWQKNEN